MLEAPIPLAGVQSPDNPLPGTATPNLPRRKGFEEMAITRDGRFLYPMLEGPLTTDADQRRLIINEFDVRARAYRGRRFFYRLEVPATTGQAIGDLTEVNDHTFRVIVIERDNEQGAAARFTKVFLVDFHDIDADGFLVKHEVADLMTGRPRRRRRHRDRGGRVRRAP